MRSYTAMRQAKFSIEAGQHAFLSSYQTYGFKDRSEMLRTAIEMLRKELEQREFEQSATLYAEIYAEDEKLQTLTDSAIAGWPSRRFRYTIGIPIV